MFKTNEESALRTAIEFAKINIESTEEWVDPSLVTHFIEEVYNFLTGENKDGE